MPHVQQLLDERQAKERELERLQDELQASKKREEVKSQQLGALQDLARQIGRRRNAAEVAKTEFEMKWRQAEEMLRTARQAVRKSKGEASKWKCRYAQAKREGTTPTGAASSPEIGARPGRYVVG